MWCRTCCPALRPRPPRSGQPSPTCRPWISRTWHSARSSVHRYKLSVPAQSCASLHRRSATWTSLATHPPAPSTRWCPVTFGDRFSNISTVPAHPGWRASSSPPVYVWKGLSTDVTAVGESLPGLPSGQGPPPRARPQHIPVPTRRFSHIHVDLVGPLPASKGFTYLFTIIDRTSRWPEAIPIATGLGHLEVVVMPMHKFLLRQ
jgi:hypothetical protein